MKKIVWFFAVICLCFACDDIIEVEDISNRTVSVLAPTDEAILNTTSINFTWEAVEDAEQYKLQIATPNFENALQIVEDSTLTDTGFSKTLEFGDYEWRIRAENSDYQTAYSTQSFTIED